MKEQAIYLIEQVKKEDFKNGTSIDMLIRELLSLKMQTESRVTESEEYLKG